MSPLLVLDVVGPDPALLRAHAQPARSPAGARSAELGTVLPAVTCSVQSTFLTGALPARARHRRQRLVLPRPRRGAAVAAAQRAGRRREALGRRPPRRTPATPSPTSAGGTRWAPTPTGPSPRARSTTPTAARSPTATPARPQLHDELTAELGDVPALHLLGADGGDRLLASGSSAPPGTSWPHRRPDLTLVYVPHLDYDLQRFGPTSPQAAAAAARRSTPRWRRCWTTPRAAGSPSWRSREYGITARRPAGRHQPGAAPRGAAGGLHPGRAWSTWTRGRRGRSPSPTTRSPTSTSPTRPTWRDVAQLLAGPARRRRGARRRGAGPLRARPRARRRAGRVAEPDAWFTYYYWLDDDRAPDFARGVEIHRKPGYDPAELFFDPADPLAKAQAGLGLARKKLGMRYPMNVVPLDPARVRGTHGRLPDHGSDGPVLLCSDPAVPSTVESRGRIEATEVRDLLLKLQGIDEGDRR